MELILDYLTALGLGGIALGMLLEALGLPGFPGGVMIILAGFLVNKGVLSFEAALGASFGGYTVGSVAAYLMGRNMGQPVARHLGRWLHMDVGRNLSRMPTGRIGGAFVLVGRFLPGLGNFTPYLAGAANLHWGWFLLYNSIFGLIWGALYLVIGVVCGHNWPVVLAFIQPRLIGLAILGALLGIAIFILQRERRAFSHRGIVKKLSRVPSKPSSQNGNQKEF